MQDESSIMQKTCGVCNELKTVDDFCRAKRGSLGRSNQCRSCSSLLGKKWRSENPDKNRDGKARWRSENPEKIMELRNQDRIKRGVEARPKGDTEAAIMKRKQSAREYARRWSRDHPDISRSQSRVHNHRRRVDEGSFTSEEWDALCAKYNYQCLACGRGDVDLTVDHIVPVKKGGTSWISNIQPLCDPCNRKKYQQTIDYRPSVGVVDQD